MNHTVIGVSAWLVPGLFLCPTWEGNGSSVLTSTERKYLQIVLAKLSNGSLSSTKLAEQFECSVATVERALSWGRKTGKFTTDSAEKLAEHIAEYRKHLEFLEKELKARKKLAREEAGGRRDAPIGSQSLKHISSEIREVRLKLMELEGIYSNIVNVQVTGKNGEDLRVHVYLPSNGRGDA